MDQSLHPVLLGVAAGWLLGIASLLLSRRIFAAAKKSAPLGNAVVHDRITRHLTVKLEKLNKKYRSLNEIYRFTKSELESLSSILEHSRQREFVDEKTGVMNEKKLIDEIGILLDKIGKNELNDFCIIHFDLEDFGEVNNRTTMRQGDAVIRVFAQTIFRSMRRDEFMFRRNVGGDEFVFVIKGNEDIALGFLNRLLTRDMVRFSADVKKIVPELGGIDFKFRAEIVEVDKIKGAAVSDVPGSAKRQEDVYALIEELERACNNAKNRDYNLRVFWPSLKWHEDIHEVSSDLAELNLLSLLLPLAEAAIGLRDLSRLSKEATDKDEKKQLQARQSELNKKLRKSQERAQTIIDFSYVKPDIKPALQPLFFGTIEDILASDILHAEAEGC